MSRAKRMDPILRLARDDEDQAARELSESARRLRETEAQLEELRGYRSDYARQLPARGVLNGSALQGFQQFMRNLDQAIAQLEESLRQQQRLNEHHLQKWVGSHNRAKAMTEIADKYRDEEQRIIEDKLQWELDDRAQHKKPQS